MSRFAQLKRHSFLNPSRALEKVPSLIGPVASDEKALQVLCIIDSEFCPLRGPFANNPTWDPISISIHLSIYLFISLSLSLSLSLPLSLSLSTNLESHSTLVKLIDTYVRTRHVASECPRILRGSRRVTSLQATYPRKVINLQGASGRAEKIDPSPVALSLSRYPRVRLMGRRAGPAASGCCDPESAGERSSM